MKRIKGLETWVQGDPNAEIVGGDRYFEVGRIVTVDVDDLDLTFVCRLCSKVWGDFFYYSEQDCCAECAGLEFVP